MKKSSLFRGCNLNIRKNRLKFQLRYTSLLSKFSYINKIQGVIQPEYIIKTVSATKNLPRNIKSDKKSVSMP